MAANGTVYYYLQDHLGSVRALVQDNGSRRNQNYYWAFGEDAGGEVHKSHQYRYTGKPLDEEFDLNLHYYGARYLSAPYGRFTQIDPLRGKYPSWSPYAYTLDNPLKFVDPNGQWTESQHNEIIDRAADGLLSREAIDAMKRASAFVDQFQDPAWNHLHAMRNDGESVGDAVAKTMSFVNENANGFVQSGNWFSLGMAAHPIMDMTAPTHAGWQVWHGMSDPMSCLRALLHGMNEVLASPKQKDIELLRRWLQYMLEMRQQHLGQNPPTGVTQNNEKKQKSGESEGRSRSLRTSNSHALTSWTVVWLPSQQN